MKILILILIGILLTNNLLASESHALMITEPNEHWIVWDSAEGIERLKSSKHVTILYKLLKFYVSKMVGTYCGIATAVIILNSLSIKPTPAKPHQKYPHFTQEEFFDGNISEIVDAEYTKTHGLSIKDMAAVLKSQFLHVQAFEADS